MIGQTSKFIIRANRGDTFSRPLNIKDSSGELIDCTGWEIRVTVRDSLPATSVDDDSGALISKVITGDASGEHTLTFTSEDTNEDAGEYYMDIQVKKDDGSIHSSRAGTFIIESDVTRGS